MAGQRAFKCILKNAGTAIGQLLSVNINGMSIDFEEITSHGQADPWREYIPTLADAGEIEFQVLMDSANQTVLEGLFSPDVAASVWTVSTSHSTAIVFTCSGWLSEYNFIDEADVNGKLTTSCKIRLTGKATMA